jgi:hypothetical protein
MTTAPGAYPMLTPRLGLAHSSRGVVLKKFIRAYRKNDE